ncbi:hypothetical protein OBBRIDRAFT_397373 [Obba rivulosa]|uniref:Uncharacterized protein n=1 Tax=Obba rivulosa TaxID=1052685 RepID=A0A8E2AM86_9APHY|nr:hypothetical protein OBBRIDRAFT_397373 [Obba rivulosa]
MNGQRRLAHATKWERPSGSPLDSGHQVGHSEQWTGSRKVLYLARRHSDYIVYVVFFERLCRHIDVPTLGHLNQGVRTSMSHIRSRRCSPQHCCRLRGAMVLVQRRRQQHPPAPRRLLFLENIFDVPPTDTPVKYLEMSREYDVTMSIDLIGARIIVLNSLSAVMDLLEKRSSIYSDRSASCTFDVSLA